MRDLSGAFKLIREFEGCRLESYRDVVGVWTIGYGTTVGVHPSMKITLEQAEQLMESDVKERADFLSRWILVPVTDHQMSALISLAYNIGMGAIYHSRLLAHINAGMEKHECAKDFLRWVHAGGKLVPGLVRRRKIEAEVFVS